MNNRLITEEVLKALKDYPLYTQDGKQKDAVCVCVFKIGNVRWYILEGQPEGNDFTFYGIVAGLCETEYGYISANELQEIKVNADCYGLGFLTVEQDKSFQPCKLEDIKDDELQNFLSVLYDKE